MYTRKGTQRGYVFYSDSEIAGLLQVSLRHVRRLLSNRELLAGTNVVFTVDNFDGTFYVLRDSIPELKTFFRKAF